MNSIHIGVQGSGWHGSSHLPKASQSKIRISVAGDHQCCQRASPAVSSTPGWMNERMNPMLTWPIASLSLWASISVQPWSYRQQQIATYNLMSLTAEAQIFPREPGGVNLLKGRIQKPGVCNIDWVWYWSCATIQVWRIREDQSENL